MQPLANKARARAGIASPYRAMLLSGLRGILAALLMTLVILLLAPLAPDRAYANTGASEVQANAPPLVANDIADTDLNAVTSDNTTSEVIPVYIEQNSGSPETGSDLQEHENAQVGAENSQSDSTENDPLATTPETNNANTGAGNNDAGASDDTADSTGKPAVDPANADTANTAITPGTVSTEITADGANNAGGCDYQSAATDLERANQSVAPDADPSSASPDSGGEVNAGIGTASTIAPQGMINITLSFRNEGYGVFWEKSPGVYEYLGGAGLNASDTTSITYTLAVDETTGNSYFGNNLPVLYSNGNQKAEAWFVLDDYGETPITGSYNLLELLNDIILPDIADGMTYEIYPQWDREKPLTFNFAPGDTATDDPNKQRITRSGVAYSATYASITSPALPTGLADAALPSNTDYTGGVWTAYYAADGDGRTYTDVINSTTKIANSGPGYVSFDENTTKNINELLGLKTSVDYIPYTEIFFWASFPNTSVNYNVVYDPRGTNTDTAITGSATASTNVSSDSYSLLNYNSFTPNYKYTGHTFDGWTVTGVDAEGHNESISFKSGYTASTVIPTGTKVTDVFTPGTGSTYTLTAHWKEIKYTIKWNASYGPPTDGSTSWDKTQTQVITWDQTIGSVSMPSGLPTSGNIQKNASGTEYEFQGWYFDVNQVINWTTATGLVVYDPDAKLSSITYHRDDGPSKYEVNIYAIWKVKAQTYKITYDAGSGATVDGASAQTDTQTVEVDMSSAPHSYKEGTSPATYRSATYDIYHTFDYWKDGSGNPYTAGDPVNGLTGDLALTAVWKGNPVTVNYLVGTGVSPTASSITPPLPTTDSSATIDVTFTFMIPTTTEGYTFAGWVDSSGNLIGSTSGTGASFTQTWKPENVTSINAYATWKPIEYTIRYHANGGHVGSSPSTTYYDVTTNASGNRWTWNDAGLVTAASANTVSRDYYTLKTTGTWTTAATGGTTVTDATAINSLTADSDNIIHLYAQWDPVEITINYVSSDPAKGSAYVNDGTNTISSETVILDGGTIKGGKAIPVVAPGASASVYKVKDWTSDGYGSSTSATIAPSPATLKNWYKNHDGLTTYEFKANFEYAEFAYYVDIYVEDQNGTFVKTPSSGHKYTAAGGTALNARADTVVNATSASVGGTTYDLTSFFLNESTFGVSNGDLYELISRTSNADGTLDTVTSLTIDTDPTKNVFVLHYKRKTFDVNAQWATAIPSTLTGNSALAATYLPATTTSIRWGQTVTMTQPSATGYTFKWTANTPSTGFTTSDNLTFTMTAAGMSALGGNTAMIDGTWTPIKYTVTFTNPGTPDAHAGMKVGGSMLTGTKTISNVPYDTMLSSSDIPTWTDSNSYEYYFAYWEAKDSSDSIYGNKYSDVDIAALVIQGDWDFTAVYLKKLQIIYNPGAHSSGWATETKHLATGVSTDTIRDYQEDGSYVAHISSAVFDADGNLAAANGYQFDHWTTNGTDSYYPIPGPGAVPDPMAAVYALPLTGSYTFTAIWKALPQPIEYHNSVNAYESTGAVNTSADTLNTTFTVTIPAYTNEADMDDTFPLLSTVNGYNNDAFTFYGWYGVPKLGGAGTTYAHNQTPTMVYGGMDFYPVFKVKTVTITYRVDLGSAGYGTVDGVNTVTDTVFVRKNDTSGKYNGVNASGHTAAETTTNGYKFIEWTSGIGGGQVSTAKAFTYSDIQAELVNLANTDGILTSGETYNAVFEPLKFKVYVDNPLNNHGTVTMNDPSNTNTVTVTYDGSNGKIIESQITSITPDTGYAIDSWIVTGQKPDGTSISTTWTGPDIRKGLTSNAVLGDLTITPVFKAKSNKDYTVYIEYVLGSAAPASKANYKVAWQEVALSGTNAAPTENGYSFTGWFADDAGTNSVQVTDTFEDLDTAGYTVPDAGYKVTLYAVFEAKPNTVYFDPYGNKAQGIAYSAEPALPTIASLTNVEWNDAIGSTRFTLPANPTRVGYTFDYWYATKGANGHSNTTTVNNIDSTSTSVTFGQLAANDNDYREVTLHAHWSPISMPLTYSFGTYTGAPANVTKSVDWDDKQNFDTYALNGSEPTRTNYVFQGWTLDYTDGNGGAAAQQIVTKGSPGITTIAELLANDPGATNITFVARWAEGVWWYYKDAYIDPNSGSIVMFSTPVTTGFSGAHGDVITFYDGSAYSADYGTPNVGDHDHAGYEYTNAYQLANGAYTYTLDANEDNNYFYIFYKAKEYTVYYYDYSDKTTVLRGADGRTPSGNQVLRNNVHWDSTDILPDPALTLPAGVDHIDWYYEDPANPGTYVKVTGATTVSTVLGTGGANATFLNLYANYVSAGVNVKFAVNDNNYATLSGSTTQFVSADAAANAVSSVTANAKPGYQFDAWYFIVKPAGGYTPSEADFTNGTLTAVSTTQGTVTAMPGTASATDSSAIQALKFYTGGSVPAGPVWEEILYVAHFSPKEYTFTLSVDSDATAPATSGATGGTKVWTDSFAIGEPTRPGYKFDGWTSSALPSGTKFNGTSSYTTEDLADSVGYYTDITLTATWATVKYRIYYYDNDTTTQFTALTREDAEWESTGLAANSNPTKAGYTFMGWDTVGDGAHALDNSTTKYFTVAGSQGVTSAQYVDSVGDSTYLYGIRLYATWKANAAFKIVVRYEDANGNAAGIIPIPTSKGFNDTVYYTYDGVTMVVSIDEATSKVNIMPTDVTADGASPIPASLDLPNAYATGYEYDVAKTLGSLSELTKTLAAADNNAENPYVFTIYYKAKDGYTLVYNANGGSYSNGKPALERTPVTWLTDDLQNYEAAAPMREGYKLVGWTTMFNGDSDYEVVSTDTYGKFAANDSTSTRVTLYAKWVEREYNINYVDINPNNLSDIRIIDSSRNVSVSGKRIDPHKWEDNVSFAAPVESQTYHATGWKFLGWSTLADPSYTNGKVFTSAKYSTLAAEQSVGRNDDVESENEGVTLYAVWAKYVPYAIEYYMPGDADPFYVDTESHTETLNPGVEGESSSVTAAELAAQRPTGYYFGESTVPSLVMTQDTGSNVLKVVYSMREDFTLIADFNGGATADGDTEYTKTGLTWFGVPTFTPGAFTRNGYTFTGKWNTQADGEGTTFDAETYGELAEIEGLTDEQALVTPVRLFAVWAMNSDYRVVYDINNDKTINTNVLTEVPAGKAQITPDPLENVSWTQILSDLADGTAMDAEPLGYHFGGWNTARDGGGMKVTASTTYEELSNYINSEVAQEQVMLYAQWDEDIIEITYITNGSGGTVTRAIDKISAVTRTPVSTGSSAGTQLTSTANANPGWHFVRWVWADGTNADPTVLSGMATTPVNTTSVTNTMLTVMASGEDGLLHEATYIAEFEENDDATLVYDVNGGNGHIDSVTAPWGSILTLSDGTGYTRPHYTLTGWNTNPDGSGTSYALSEKGFVLPKEGDTLYAMWKPKTYPSTITSKVTGGTVTEKVEDVEYSKKTSTSTVTASHPTPNPGYVFAGWTYEMTDGETGVVTTGTVNDPSELAVVGPVTFTALFEKEPSAVEPTGSDVAGTRAVSSSGGGYYGGASGKTMPATGDRNYLFVLALMAAAAVLAGMAFVSGRRRNSEGESDAVALRATKAGSRVASRILLVAFSVFACVALSAVFFAQEALASEAAVSQDAVVVVQGADEAPAAVDDSAGSSENIDVVADASANAGEGEHLDVVSDEKKGADTESNVDDAANRSDSGEEADDAEPVDEEAEANAGAIVDEPAKSASDSKKNEGATSGDAKATKSGDGKQAGENADKTPQQYALVDAASQTEEFVEQADEADEPAAEEIEEETLVMTVASIQLASTSGLVSASNTLEAATSVRAPVDQLDAGKYYLTGVTPVFGKYFLLDSSTGYPSLTDQSSSLGPDQQWELIFDHDDTFGKLYRIKSASNFYLIASRTGIASITSVASNDPGAFWRTVTTTYNDLPAVALFNADNSDGVYRLLARVVEKNAAGTSVTMTVENIPCGNISYPAIPDSGWLWYYTSVTPLDWDITYDDTTGATGSTAQTHVAGGSIATIASNGFTKPGYIFVNWNTAENGTGTSYAENQRVEYNNYADGYVLKLYAQWREDAATVTYSAGSGGLVGLGSGASASARSVSETVGAATGVLSGTQSATFSGATARALTGHHFQNWTSSGTTSIDPAGAVSLTITPTTVARLSYYSDAGSTVNVYHGLTVTANFDPNTYTIAYDANGGSGTLAASSATYGSNNTLTAASTLSQSGYTFNGWNTKADGSGIALSDSAMLSTSSINRLISTNALADTDGAMTTLYAQWKQVPTPAPTPSDSGTSDTPAETIVTPSVEDETGISDVPQYIPVYPTETGNPVTDALETVVEAVAEPAAAAKDAVLEVSAASTEALVTAGTTIADGLSASADSGGIVDALANLTPAEAAQAATTTVAAVAAVSTVASLVGAGASIAGAIAGAGALGAGAAGAAGVAGAAGAADLAADLAAESAVGAGLFARLRRRIRRMFGLADPGDDDSEDSEQ